MIYALLDYFRPRPKPDYTLKTFEDAMKELMAERRREELRAIQGRGEWVKVADMHPQTNIVNRLYRTTDGTVRRASMFPLHTFYPNETVEAWFFPED